jgi:hypothetical protein
VGVGNYVSYTHRRRGQAYTPLRSYRPSLIFNSNKSNRDVQIDVEKNKYIQPKIFSIGNAYVPVKYDEIL